jgi:hypothetical protein
MAWGMCIRFVHLDHEALHAVRELVTNSIFCTWHLAVRDHGNNP